MAHETLKRLLLGEEGLFKTQLALAEAIRAADADAYPNVRPLSSFLGQILAGHRSFPKGLAELVAQVARQEVTAKDGVAAGEQMELRIRAELGATADSPVDQLLARQLRAHTVLIINPEPQEVKRHPRAEDFQAAMCRALSEEDGTTYHFILSEEDKPAIADQWRQTERAFARVLAEDDGTNIDAAEKLTQLNEAGRIYVSCVPSHLCAIPVIAFDAERRSGWPDVYIWDSVVEDGKPIDTIIRFSPELRIRWIRDVYRRLLFDEEISPRKNCAFNDFRGGS